MTSLYHLRSASPRDTYRITKLDADYSIEASYLVSKHECTCPAGARDTCRHRQMLPFFLQKEHVDNGWMLDWHTRQWRKPLCEDGREQPIDAVRSQEDLAGTPESPDIMEAEGDYRNAIEEPVPPAASSLEAEVERGQGPASAPSASTQMKRRKI